MAFENASGKNLRIALAQINMTVGDIGGNTRKILDYLALAREAGVQVVAFPELAVTGYPPEDLLLKNSFLQANMCAIDEIATQCKDLCAVVGFVDVADDIYNAAAVICNGRVCGVQHKQFLPNYGVFDENRYFQSGRDNHVFDLGGAVFGVEICEDAWYSYGPHSMQTLVGGAKLVIDINGSPYSAGKWEARQRMLATRAQDNACVLAYVNAVGGQDELVFDGHSMVFGCDGEVVFRARAFEEQLAVVDVDLGPVDHARRVDPRRRKARLSAMDTEVVKKNVLPNIATSCVENCVSESSQPMDYLQEIYAALVLGTKDYVNKNGFRDVVLGLSGGIDSALTAAVAVDALGRDRVRGVVMPSEFSSHETQSDAKKLANNLGIECDEVGISEVFNTYKEMLAGVFRGAKEDVTEENLQARVRGNILMAISNKFGSLVLTTGNKSELACGYSTLYGDMAGGFAVIKDVPKTLVYSLAEYVNRDGEVIPVTIIERPPSAELRPDQTDQDSLPPYEVLDQILHYYIEEDRGVREIVQMGFGETMVRDVINLVDKNEYKRRQAAPGVKITAKAFGRDRRLPITNKYRE